MKAPTSARLKQLTVAARHAAGRAYAPYSGFPVGAAVLTAQGKIFSGCNVENASYGLCNCAERTAVFSAVAAGHQRIPCVACRQAIFEFGPASRVISICDGKERIDMPIGDLLPRAFGPADLK